MSAAVLGDACDEKIFDDGTIGNAFYYNDSMAVMARKFEGSSSPVGLEWGEINTISLGDPFYPWPDSTYDPIEVTMISLGGGFGDGTACLSSHLGSNCDAL
jgi:hypothetical protein